MMMILMNRIIPNRSFFQEHRGYSELRRDFPSLHICKDFMRLVSCWQSDDQHEVPLFSTMKVNTQHVPAEKMKSTTEADVLPIPYDVSRVQSLTEGVTPETAKYRINVKFALFSGMDMDDISKLEGGKESFNQLIKFLVLHAKTKRQIFLSGGIFGLTGSLDDITDELLIGKAMYVVR